MPNNIEAGMNGQQEAERYLIEKGVGIIERNYRIKSGEIDLIGQDGEYVVFIEVKYRSSLSFGYPCEAVNIKKQRKIIKTALHYINHKRLSHCGFRFDVVEILKQNGSLEITHIENAFS